MSAPKKIVVLPGDHVGQEITAEAIKVLKAISDVRSNVKFDFENHLIGGAAIDATGVPLPDEALEASKKADAVLLGAVGDLSPIKPQFAKGTDFVVVRELVGGIYFGKRKEDDGDGVAWDSEQYTVPEVQRITRMAAFMALQHEPPLPIWSLDKANVLASSRLWRKTVEETIKNEFPTLKVQHQLIDSAAMILVKNPTHLNGIIITSNMFGDIISDEASVIPGSLGFNTAFGLYEPCHGSAPDLPKNKVNPIATILSAAMMLKLSLNLPEEGKAIEDAVKKVLDAGIRTGDLGGSNSTTEVGDAVAEEVKKILA
ncbi:CBM_collapsed_G0008090.mRNA.1.CDS.1 [Saccharomyces cerevisiae]|nr:CBK_G0005350.mRNA.1.CDS.1 [Saccharomyces cerevisiae]CAI6379425.1 CBM_HP1_G0004220.mRNA.1.CDS.1 [Saccharomyces cerevisiae]CAI7134362.1 CBM_collapsed_G0008090.mRNA.1.CDS.1 [Saccharomyces cerevisiae]CAI7166496.1 CBK_G0005350.mRNA.1.CDS.1 [Saccharomyces cerevisiae]